MEAIAAVDGIDVLHVGSNDLLVDMGKPGRFDDPAILAADGPGDRRGQGQRQVRRAAAATATWRGRRRRSGAARAS